MSVPNQTTLTESSGHHSAHVADWIDRHAIDPQNLESVTAQLTEWTLPRDLSVPAEIVDFYRGDLDAQFWFWNRAANNYYQQGHFHAAAEIWSAHYLCCLSLQLKLHHRFHKGMPLCNIGFAFARGGRRRLAAKSWLIGIIEDTITDPTSAEEALNYQNLLKIRTAPAVLGQLINAIESRFLDQSIIPIFPESAIELWLDPRKVVPSKVYLQHVEILSDKLIGCYPNLPNYSTPWEELLAPFWGFADWVERVVND